MGQLVCVASQQSGEDVPSIKAKDMADSDQKLLLPLDHL